MPGGETVGADIRERARQIHQTNPNLPDTVTTAAARNEIIHNQDSTTALNNAIAANPPAGDGTTPPPETPEPTIVMIHGWEEILGWGFAVAIVVTTGLAFAFALLAGKVTLPRLGV